MTKNALKTYKDWIDAGFVTLPCDNKKSILPKWSKPNFKVTTQDWQNNHIGKQIAIRLDEYIDFDIDNSKVRFFVNDHIKYCGAIFGRRNSPMSHYLWKGKIEAKKFILPDELEEKIKKEKHGATICEIRCGTTHYTVVPESKYHLGDETIEWEKYEGITMYPKEFDLTADIGKIALQTALCICYPTKGSRDKYCTAVAGVLLKHGSWTTEQVDLFVHNLAIQSKDDEAILRAKKGTSHSKSDRQYGMNTLAEIINCSKKTIATLFSWVGIGYSTVEGASAIGDIIEYARNKYEVKISGSKNGQAVQSLVKMDGPTLRDMKKFYDEVITQAQIWVPKMKPIDFETIVKNKFEERIKAKDYIEGDAQAEVFRKHFDKYLQKKLISTDPKQLLNFNMPTYHLKKQNLDFKLAHFEDYLDEIRFKYGDRNDLKKSITDYLDGTQVNGKIKDEDKQYKSCVHWRVPRYEIQDPKILILEGETIENKEVKQIDFEADAIKN